MFQIFKIVRMDEELGCYEYIQSSWFIPTLYNFKEAFNNFLYQPIFPGMNWVIQIDKFLD